LADASGGSAQRCNDSTAPPINPQIRAHLLAALELLDQHHRPMAIAARLADLIDEFDRSIVD